MFSWLNTMIHIIELRPISKAITKLIAQCRIVDVWKQWILAMLVACFLLGGCSENTSDERSVQTDDQVHKSESRDSTTTEQGNNTEHNFSVDNAWVRALPPTQKTTAAYLDIANISTSPQTLIGVVSPVVDKIEMHIVLQDGEQMQMRKVEKILIAPAQRILLKPGGQHLMLIGLKKELDESESVPLELIFKSGERLKIQAPVSRVTSADSKEHSHH